MSVRTVIPALGWVIGASAVGWALDMTWLGVAAVAALFGIVLLFLPEVTFVLFLTAGAFKADPRLAAIGTGLIDITALLELLCAAGIALGIVQGRIVFKKLPGPLFGAIAVLLFLALLSFVYTPAPIYGREKLIRFAGITTFALLAPWLLIRDWSSLRRLLYTWVFVTGAMVLDVVSGGVQPGEQMFREAFNSSGYLGLAVVCAQGVLIVSFAIVPTVRGLFATFAAIGLGAAYWFGALVSGARTANVVLAATMAGVFFTLIGWLWVRAPRGRSAERAAALKLVGVSSVTFVPLLLIVGPYFVYLQQRLQNLLNASSFYAAERLSLVPAALNAMTAAPWGLGIGGFSMYFYNLDRSRGGFPHNILLEVGSELGLIGLAAFLVLSGAAVQRALRGLGHVTGTAFWHGITVIALWSFEFLYFQFHGDLNDARVLFAWTGVLYAFAFLASNKSPEARTLL